MNSQFIIVAVILVIAFIAILAFANSSKKTEPDWNKKMKGELSRISTEKNSPHKLVELDKLMDFYLKNSKVKGETMGERLKKSKKMFTKNDYNKIWQAHKLRNQVVHEVGFKKDPKELDENIRNLTSIITKL